MVATCRLTVVLHSPGGDKYFSIPRVAFDSSRSPRMIVCFPEIYREMIAHRLYAPYTLSFSYYRSCDALRYIPKAIFSTEIEERNGGTDFDPRNKILPEGLFISRRPTWWQEWGIISVTKLIKQAAESRVTMNLELDSIRARGARVPGRSYQVVVQVCSSCPVNTIGRWKDHACSPAANAGFSMVGGEEGEKLPGQLTSPKSRYYCSPFKPSVSCDISLSVHRYCDTYWRKKYTYTYVYFFRMKRNRDKASRITPAGRKIGFWPRGKLFAGRERSVELKAMGVDSARVSWKRVAEPHERRRMKIHERLESKAVDIRIQKMASLTLNGHHYARPTNTRRVCTTATSRLRLPGVAERERGSVVRWWIDVGVSGAHHERSPRHCRLACDDRSSALSFRAVPFEKGVTRAVIWKKERKKEGRKADYTQITAQCIPPLTRLLLSR